MPNNRGCNKREGSTRKNCGGEGVKYGLKCSLCKSIAEKNYFNVPNHIDFFIFNYLCEKVAFFEKKWAKNGKGVYY